MNNLIIGHRGFVGSNLGRQIPNAVGVGRAEIASIAGLTFGDIYCAAPQAKKWWANKNPDQDKQEVDNLIESCRQVSCTGHFVLFSTVDIYDPPTGKTENDLPSSHAHPYGAHRFHLEQCILDHFRSRTKVIRLPALVGQGLKKNIIYDLLNNNNVELINANSSFQWFNLDFLDKVLKIAFHLQGSHLLNIASEPLPTEDLVRTLFPYDIDRLNWQGPSICYDIRTIYGQSDKPYLFSKEEVLESHLTPFIMAETAKR